MESDDRADTARRPKPSGRKAKKLSQQEQSERFIETARELEADESGKNFERALRAVASEHKRRP
jgi:hypothetical protein